MSSIIKNSETELNLLTIIEAGYKYIVPHSYYSNMQLYLLQYDLMSAWYNLLSESDRKRIERIRVNLN